jgi:hypothetical protein
VRYSCVCGARGGARWSFIAAAARRGRIE